MSILRIVYVLTACKKCGPINQTLNIIKNLDRTEFDPILVTIYPEEDDSLLDLYLPYVKHFYAPTSKLDIMLGRDKILRQLLEEINPDVIHSVGVFPDYAISRMKKWKQVSTIRAFVYDDFPAKFGKLKGTILAKIHLHALKRTTKTVACSESLAKIYKHRLGFTFDFVRNGVDIEKYEIPDPAEKLAVRKSLGIPEDKFVYIYTGQMIERKNVGFLLDVYFANFKDEKSMMILLGDGPLLDCYKEKYGKADNIVFRGSVDNVQYYLKACDAYVSTSTSEGLPNGVLEAMATGLPVILSDIDQHLEIYNEEKGIGFVYHQGKSDELFKCLKDIQLNSKEMGNIAYNSSHQNFSASKMSGLYQEIYKKL